MTISVEAPADDYLLTTLQAVKTLLNITEPVQDALLNTLILRASYACNQYCRRVFAKEQVLETIPGSGTARLMLERTPLVTIDQVDYEGDTIDASEYEIERHGTGTILRENKWTLNTLGDDIGKPDWEITYTAGYVLPNHSGTRDLPYDVEQGAIEVIKAWYYARCRDGTLRTEEVVDVWQGTYSGQAIPMAAKQLLNPWRVLGA